MKNTADHLNTLAAWLGPRDLPDLTTAALKKSYGLEQVDVCVLFGGSILAGGDEMAKAIKNRIARTYILVGGAGHTTDSLRSQMSAYIKEADLSSWSEARLFQEYLKNVYGVQADYLETESTNCGNNITFLLQLLKTHQIACSSMILIQDASMQRRMQTGLMKYAPDMLAINYAACQAELKLEQEGLVFTGPVHGMWDIPHYCQLLMGEIPRLTDNEGGYGPCGKDFIAHVDIPEDVQNAFHVLSSKYPSLTRPADSQYASSVVCGETI